MLSGVLCAAGERLTEGHPGLQPAWKQVAFWLGKSSSRHPAGGHACYAFAVFLWYSGKTLLGACVVSEHCVFMHSPRGILFQCDKILLYEHQRCSGSRGLILNRDVEVVRDPTHVFVRVT